MDPYLELHVDVCLEVYVSKKKAMALSEAWASEGPYYEIRHLLGGSDGPLTCKHGVLWLSGEVFHGVYILYGNSHALLYGTHSLSHLLLSFMFCSLYCLGVFCLESICLAGHGHLLQLWL